MQSAGGRLKEYVREMARTVVRGVLTAVKINTPGLHPRKAIKIPHETPADSITVAQAEVAEAADKYADRLELF